MTGGSDMNRYERAFQIWPILTDVARRRGKITYSELADTIHSTDRRLGWPLGVIQDYCLAENLPPLTILVVAKQTGQPGHGFTALDLAEQEAGYEAVWNTRWPKANPFAYAADGTPLDDFVKVLLTDPERAEEVYTRVKARGSAQILFQKAVRRAYGDQCAFCGLTFTQCLEAAHIIPWASASGAERIDPRNGILLCANHHRLFDAGFMTLNCSGEIVYSEEADETYCDSDLALTATAHGRKANLPRSLELWPSKPALAWHYEAQRWTDAPWRLSV